MHSIEIIKPITSEKTARASERQRAYTFVVSPHANKYQIRRVVEATYGVRVVKANTLTTHGKVKRRGNSVGRRPNLKKAMVTLAEGDTIDLYATE